jgi:hypothetical protein
MPIPLLRRYKHIAVNKMINPDIIPKARGIETSLDPNIPSLNVFTT